MNCVRTKGNLALFVFPKCCFRGISPTNIFINEFPLLFLKSAYCTSVNASVHDHSQSVEDAQPQPVKKYKKPVDWLPFAWHRRPMKNFFEDSGDYVKTLEFDPSWPKPDFELSEELKTANEDVYFKFSLASASKGEIKEAVRRRTLEKIQRHPFDFQSLEVKIALQTLQVRSLFEHAKQNKKDIRGSRRVLYIVINKRNRSLKTLRNIDTERFEWICKELKLYYKPQQLGGIREMYCKKWDLRRLTKEYCKKTIEDKKVAFHEELKRQQEDFLKEKEEILAWIEREEKELANLSI